MDHKLRRVTSLFLSLTFPGLILIFLFGIFQPAQADPTNIYRVAKTGDGLDGSNWDHAFTDLQEALSVTISGDEIWVATGVYTPGAFITDTFQLVNGVEIYGGFAAMETLRSQRNWETNVTVLSGDISGDDTTDSNGVVTATANISGDNSYHVVNGSGVFSTTILDGFTITAGHADGDYSNPCDGRCGGGIYNSSGGNPVLNNIIFIGNLAQTGGGVYNYSCRPTLTDVTFSNNSATFGGGIANWTSSPTLTNVIFSGNSVDNDGGGIYNIYESNPTLITVTFNENMADHNGGGMYNKNGSNPILTNVTFSENSADGVGGGIYNDGNSSTLTDVTFLGNSAFSGGGMYNFVSDPILDGGLFDHNSAGMGHGGGIYNDSSSPTLMNVTFLENSATHYDGGGGL